MMKKIEMIPDWFLHDHECHFCGTQVSVKYFLLRSGIQVPCCNKCMLIHWNEELR